MNRPFLVTLLLIALTGCAARAERGVSTVASVPEDTFGGSGLAIDFFGVPLSGAHEVVFVVDRSGSMAEEAVGLDDADLAALSLAGVDLAERAPSKMDATRRQLLRALNGLPDGTRFNIVFFDSTVSAFQPALVVLGPETRARARAFVERQPLDLADTTAAAAALRRAYRLAPQRIVFLSDGISPADLASPALLTEAREAIRHGVRIDTVGLGFDDDSRVMFALAEESGGVTVMK